MVVSFHFAFVAVAIFLSFCSGRVLDVDVSRRQATSETQSLKTQLQNICDRRYSASKESHLVRHGYKQLLTLPCLASVVGNKLFVNAGQDLKDRNQSTLDYIDCWPPFFNVISLNHR